MASAIENATLEYWDMQSRGEPIRYMLADLGVPWVEKDVTQFEKDSMDLELYPFNQLPILEATFAGHTKRLAQKNAILRYLAAVTGQVGSGDLEQEHACNMLENAVEDLQMNYIARVYSPRAEIVLKDLATEMAPKVFKQLEHFYQKWPSSGGFFLYNDFPSPPEYSLLYIVYAITILRPSVLDEFPVMSAWYTMMRNRKGIKKYLESGEAKKMLNGSETGQKQYA